MEKGFQREAAKVINTLQNYVGTKNLVIYFLRREKIAGASGSQI